MVIVGVGIIDADGVGSTAVADMPARNEKRAVGKEGMAGAKDIHLLAVHVSRVEAFHRGNAWAGGVGGIPNKGFGKIFVHVAVLQSTGVGFGPGVRAPAPVEHLAGVEETRMDCEVAELKHQVPSSNFFCGHGLGLGCL